MNLSKSYEFFQPEMLEGKRVHIIGCGSVGSTVAENIARFGITDITLYDFDKVEAHNIANQMFTDSDIGKDKVQAVYEYICKVNPECEGKVKLANEGWTGQRLSGYVFLCVDSIELRRQIVEQHKSNTSVKAMFDFRTGLTIAQHYAASWSDVKMVDNLLAAMQFSHEEAKEVMPTSACGVSLSVCPTIRVIVGFGVENFINFVKNGVIKKFMQVDIENFMFEAF